MNWQRSMAAQWPVRGAASEQKSFDCFTLVFLHFRFLTHTFSILPLLPQRVLWTQIDTASGAGVAPRQSSSLLYSRVLQLTPKGLSAHLVVRREFIKRNRDSLRFCRRNKTPRSSKWKPPPEKGKDLAPVTSSSSSIRGI